MADFVCPGILSPSLAVFNRVYGTPITAARDREATAEQCRIGEERQKWAPLPSTTYNPSPKYPYNQLHNWLRLD